MTQPWVLGQSGIECKNCLISWTLKKIWKTKKIFSISERVFNMSSENEPEYCLQSIIKILSLSLDVKDSIPNTSISGVYELTSCNMKYIGQKGH